MGKNDDEEGPGGDDCPPPGGDEKLFCCTPGYRVLVKDSIVIMSEEGAWRKNFPGRNSFVP